MKEHLKIIIMQTLILLYNKLLFKKIHSYCKIFLITSFKILIVKSSKLTLDFFIQIKLAIKKQKRLKYDMILTTVIVKVGAEESSSSVSGDIRGRFSL